MTRSEEDRLEHLRIELESIAKARSKLDLSVVDLPSLTALAGGSSGLDELYRLINKAIAGLPSGASEAAEILLADTEQRWRQNLKSRMAAAAPLVGVRSYHTFRDRKRPGGRSRFDELLLAVAVALSDTTMPGPSEVQMATVTRSGTDRPQTDEVPDTEGDRSHETGEKPSSALRSLRLLVALLSVAAVVVWLTGGQIRKAPASGEPAPIGLTIEGCDIPLGASTEPQAAPEDLVELLRVSYQDAGGAIGAGCPIHMSEHWQDLWLQHLDGGDNRPPGFLVAHPPSDSSIWIEWSAAEAYRQDARGQVQTIDGYPIESATEDGHHTVELSSGGMLFSQRAGGPAFWIPARAVSAWQARGGAAGELGMPMTKVHYADGRLHQDYEHGYMDADPEGSVTVVVTGSAEVSAYLGGRDVTDKIIRSNDGTAWWIGDDGIRRWIPDGGVWSCVGGDDALADGKMPGWVIASFPVGEPKSCE